MIAERIVFLREHHHLTQAGLAKTLGITRSSVNAWEMGISVPSTQYIVEMARFFAVSTDYLLGVQATTTLDMSGLDSDDVELLYQLKEHLLAKNKALGD